MHCIFRFREISLISLVIGIGFPATGYADIYAYTEENGVINFSNIPSEEPYKLYMRTPAVAADPSSIVNSSESKHAHMVKHKRFELYVQEAAQTFQVEAALLHAIITAESNYNAGALSRKGAIGLMQLMPGTAKQYGVSDPYDPNQNIQGGAQYLKYLMGLFNNDLQLVLAAYNAGENAVRRYGNRLPPYQETIRYVPKVLSYYQKYREKI